MSIKNKIIVWIVERLGAIRWVDIPFHIQAELKDYWESKSKTNQ